jgi:hypothetical protein
MTQIRLLGAFLGLALLAMQAIAQPAHAIPPQQFKEKVSELSEGQKKDVQAYLRHNGASREWEIQQTYEKMDETKRGRTVQFISYLQQKEKGMVPERTTVSWDRDTLQFGIVEEGHILLDSFQVTNTGTAPYLIRDVKTSCDCTVLRVPAFPVMPGETATIRVEFDSRNKAGNARPGIILYDNSRPNARNILYLNGQVVPRKKMRNPLADN